MGATIENLTPFEPGDPRTIEIARKGGKARAGQLRERKMLRELAQLILDEQTTDAETGAKMTQGEAALRVQARKAIREGDVKALEFLRDTAGEKPSATIDVNGTLKAEQARFGELWEQLNEGGR